MILGGHGFSRALRANKIRALRAAERLEFSLNRSTQNTSKQLRATAGYQVK